MRIIVIMFCVLSFVFAKGQRLDSTTFIINLRRDTILHFDVLIYEVRLIDGKRQLCPEGTKAGMFVTYYDSLIFWRDTPYIKKH